MQVDPRLEAVDDSLYRVAVRALVVENNKILLVKECDGGDWWAIPGGGVDYGETFDSSLIREIEEELGVAKEFIDTGFEIIHHSIGKIVNGVPRMNVYFKVSLHKDKITKTADVELYQWFTEKEFLEIDLNPSYNKSELASVIFN